jgi:hypothetical protein
VSTDPGGAPGGSGAGPAGAPGQPSEEELRAAYEAELSRITSADMMLQAAVSLLNIGSFRLAPGPAPGGEGAPGQAQGGRDLEQVRDAIDGVRALLEILERRVPGELAPLRNALSQLQMAYAREAQASGAEAPGAAAAPQGGEASPAGVKPPDATDAPGAADVAGGQPGEGEGEGEGSTDDEKRGPGPAESSGRLWVPGR